jgi:16S rRNA (cytidine1402-2'-O)-methyltransferase
MYCPYISKIKYRNAPYFLLKTSELPEDRSEKWTATLISIVEYGMKLDRQNKKRLRYLLNAFKRTIGIVSESGCPGIADPGQLLVANAHRMNAVVRPLSGPSSIFLALMASGMNGQQFTFNGYLPIATPERTQKIKELEKKVQQDNYTQIFIETPYRNNPLLHALISTCQPHVKLCIAFNLTAKDEWVVTKSIADWKKDIPELPKSPAIFLIGN